MEAFTESLKKETQTKRGCRSAIPYSIQRVHGVGRGWAESQKIEHTPFLPPSQALDEMFGPVNIQILPALEEGREKDAPY